MITMFGVLIFTKKKKKTEGYQNKNVFFLFGFSSGELTMTNFILN